MFQILQKISIQNINVDVEKISICSKDLDLDPEHKKTFGAKKNIRSQKKNSEPKKTFGTKKNPVWGWLRIRLLNSLRGEGSALTGSFLVK